MTETQLRQDLTRAYHDVHLDDPVDYVLRRGQALRRRRRFPMIALTAAAATTTLVVTGPLGNTPSAFATWSDSPKPISAAATATITKNCNDTYPNTPPLTLVDARGDVAFALFVGRDTAVDCTLLKHHGSWTNATTGSGFDSELRHRAAVRHGQAVISIESRTDLTNVADDAHAASTWGWVAPAVKSVQINADGHTTHATVKDGVFAAWWPYDGNASKGGTITSYGAGGQLARTAFPPMH